MKRTTKFNKKGKKVVVKTEVPTPEMVSISREQFDKLSKKIWTIDQALPSRVGDLPEKSFKDAVIDPELPRIKADIPKLRNAIGDAVLLLLWNLTKNFDGLWSEMHFDNKNNHKMMWDAIMMTIYHYEVERVHPRKKVSISKLKRTMKNIEKDVERLFGGKEAKTYDIIIKRSDIHKAKEIDMKRAIPITSIKMVKPKRAKK